MLKKYLVVLWFVVYSLSNLVYAQDVQVQSTKIDNNLYLLAATILSDSKLDETTPKNNTESGSILTKKVRI
jgi:hypothetical protein